MGKTHFIDEQLLSRSFTKRQKVTGRVRNNSRKFLLSKKLICTVNISSKIKNRQDADVDSPVMGIDTLVRDS